MSMIEGLLTEQTPSSPNTMGRLQDELARVGAFSDRAWLVSCL